MDLAYASRLTMVGELTASIAHEIGQPLGAILSNAELWRSCSKPNSLASRKRKDPC